MGRMLRWRRLLTQSLWRHREEDEGARKACVITIGVARNIDTHKPSDFRSKSSDPAGYLCG